jgi:hypothetical protein
MKIKYLCMSVLFLAITACDTDTEEPNSSEFEFTQVFSGDADCSSYVSMGGSITAGVTDASLFMAGQMGSYPNIMASVMSQTDTGGEFTQPYVDDNVGGINVGGEQFWGARFFFDGAGPAQVPGTPSTEATNVVPGPYSNLAFPFASAISYVAPGAGSLEGLAAGLANPWFVRAASSNDATMVGDALTQQPTFVTFEPGNDFFNYALTGRFVSPLELEGPTGMLAGVVGTLQALSASVPNGVITNLPDPTNTATFNTVDWNPVPLDSVTAGFLNQNPQVILYNEGLLAVQAAGLISAEEVALRTLNAVEGQNGLLINDFDLTDLEAFGLPIPSIRLTNANDKVNLLFSSFIGTQPDPTNPQGIVGVTIPMSDGAVLTAIEIDEIQTKLATANAAISASVPSGWALFDLHALYNEVVTTGLQVDEYTMTGDLVFGGFFGLDGIHPTSRGSAAIAKRMMAAIDATWGSTLLDSGLEIGDYPTNYPPSM